MKNAKILDCTLRDGAYLIDKTFGEPAIKGITKGLVKSGIDFVEVGFFQDEGFGPGKTVYKNSEMVKPFIPKDKGQTMFTVLADCSRYSVSNLDECQPDSIDAVRECFFKKEVDKAIENCKVIKEKGYKLFVQPVDILGYSDKELLDLIQKINEVEPYSLSIVDTFGSMFPEDLRRVFEIINHNLVSTAKIGFHSHNNMQLSNALSQEFLRMSISSNREVIVDGTLNGMGRGAGNTPTELIAQYMDSKLGYKYDMDAILDVIDGYMDNIRSRCTWGYTTQYFIAGAYGAHVNNITYLMKKASIHSKDIRYILNKVGATARKRYNYDLLEDTYINYINSEIDDSEDIKRLKEKISGKKVLVLVPGASINTQKDAIKEYLDSNDCVVISVSFIPKEFNIDFMYLSNVNRYEYWSYSEEFSSINKIMTSNINADKDDKSYIVSFGRLVKCGWEHLDNSTILLLRLLDELNVASIAIAGFDGYDYQSEGKSNYASQDIQYALSLENLVQVNEEIESMLEDYKETRTNRDIAIDFITDSRFKHIFNPVDTL